MSNNSTNVITVRKELPSPGINPRPLLLLKPAPSPAVFLLSVIIAAPFRILLGVPRGVPGAAPTSTVPRSAMSQVSKGLRLEYLP